MSSLHRLPSSEVESVLNNENDGQNESSSHSINEDMNNSNGKAFGKSIDSLHIFNDGQVVIGSSNLFGQQMNGFVTKYLRIEDVPLMPVLTLNPNYGGICNLIATRDKKLICGFDSGHISLLNEDLEEQIGVIYHDNQLCRLNVNKLQTKTVSCSYDSSIIVLDLQTFLPNKCYSYAHSSYIWDVDFNLIDDNMLLSCGRDRDVLIWDLRQSKPASKLVSLKSEPTALCWSSKDTSNAYIGSSCGQLLLFDVRRPGHEIAVRNISNKSIYRLKTVLNGNSVAVCADETNFQVYSFDLLNCIYENNTKHSDWIRAVCEHNGLLYTVGRDTRLVCHSLNEQL
jgi:WD40 repeat protein